MINKKIISLILFITLITIALLSSCVSKKKMIYLQDKKAIQGEFVNTNTKAYQLKPGDQLYIRINSFDKKTNKFFQSGTQSANSSTNLYLNSYTIDDNGFLDFSFIEKIKVDGLTIEETRDLIQSKMNIFFKETTVFIKLTNYNVTVIGEVREPGEFSVERDQVNVFQAIGMAQGINDYGNREKVVLVRKTTNGSSVHYLDLTDKKILESEFYYLLPNDVLYIEPLNAKTPIWGTNPFQITIATMTTVLGIMYYLHITNIFSPTL